MIPFTHSDNAVTEDAKWTSALSWRGLTHPFLALFLAVHFSNLLQNGLLCGPNHAQAAPKEVCNFLPKRGVLTLRGCGRLQTGLQTSLQLARVFLQDPQLLLRSIPGPLAHKQPFSEDLNFPFQSFLCLYSTEEVLRQWHRVRTKTLAANGRHLH